MESPSKSSSSTQLFQVFLRLRPPHLTPPAPPTLYPQLPSGPQRFLTVEPPSPTNTHAPPLNTNSNGERSTHITIHPPQDSRRRAVEKFGFTEVFEESATQLEVFDGIGVEGLVDGVLHEGRDALLATLGVTGSGKASLGQCGQANGSPSANNVSAQSHTILGSKSQRGLTQLSLDLLFRGLSGRMAHPASHVELMSSLAAADASEAQLCTASMFLENAYGDGVRSRATTPLTVGHGAFPSADPPSVPPKSPRKGGLWDQWGVLGLRRSSDASEGSPRPAAAETSTPARAKSARDARATKEHGHLRFAPWDSPRNVVARAKTRLRGAPQDISAVCPPTPRAHRTHPLPRPDALPTAPDLPAATAAAPAPAGADYAVLVSMYEVYNDRIFDLLSLAHQQHGPGAAGPAPRRRPLLFKSTEAARERKVVAGLRKVVCASYDEALLVLEAGLTERRVAGTGSNSVSSRSHGFFCVEVKRRPQGAGSAAWQGAQLTIVDLAGSERARNAKTAGATLAEAGKINESLMYLGQCLQMQSDFNENNKPSIVPFRQCKLTELLFSNSFPSHLPVPSGAPAPARNAQRGVMIVTADPLGDFNATSQILRYAALAREVTVPRIPSVTDIVFHGARVPSHERKPSGTLSGVDAGTVATLESEVSRLGIEVEVLALRLAEEQQRRRQAEEGWKRASERAEEVEAEVREECWADAEKRIVEEKRRWMDALSEEADRHDEHLDRKLDIVTQSFQIHEDREVPSQSSSRLIVLENENEYLHAKLAAMEREMLGRSPTRSTSHGGNLLLEGLSNLHMEDKENEEPLSPPKMKNPEPPAPEVAAVKSAKTPGRKVRKLTPRTNVGAWIEDDDDEEEAFWGRS